MEVESNDIELTKTDLNSIGSRECSGLPSQEEAVRLAEGSADHEIIILLGELEVRYCERGGLGKVRQALAISFETFFELEIRGHDYAVMLGEAYDLDVLDVSYVVPYAVMDPVVDSEESTRCLIMSTCST